MSKIAELEQAIRTIFNIPRRHKKSRESHQFFLQACSSLNAIGDTELAFEAYLDDNREYTNGMLYILMYGVLQAMFLQQDAIKNLAESLHISQSLPSKLREIRELRNDAIGHPTKRDVKKNNHSFHYISRCTLSKKGFQLLSTNSNSDDHQCRNILIDDVLGIQSQFAEGLLTEILNHLKADENSHREKYMNDKLKEIFHPTLDYSFEKVREGILDKSHRRFALENFEAIIGYFDQFEKNSLNVAMRNTLSM